MARGSRLGCCGRVAIYVIVLSLSAFALAQGNPPQDDSDQGTQASDLAAAAKLAREQQAREKGRRTEQSQAVDQMAKELSEADEEPIAGAPPGYRYYYFKPGDYAILVPADAKPEARDNFGLRLFSSEALSSRIEVILGEPIIAQGGTPEEILHNANAEYFGSCALNISGLGPPVDGHPAHSLAFRNCGLDHEVLGGGELVLGDGIVVPVYCGYPMTAQDWDPSPNQPIQRIIKKYDREGNGIKVCNLILPSLKFHPYGNRWAPKNTATSVKKTSVTPALASNLSEQESSQTSLGSFVRAHRKAPQAAVLTELKGSAAGFNALTFRYFCTKDNSECYDATLQLPANAKRNDQFLQPYTGLFQYEVPFGSEKVIIQANTGAPSDGGFLTREQLINSKVNWWLSYGPAEHYSSVKTATVLTEEQTELSGIPARLATFRNETGTQPVITYMAAYLVPGKFLHFRCTVPEKISGDAQSLCERTVQSLTIPQPQQEQVDPPETDDP